MPSFITLAGIIGFIALGSALFYFISRASHWKRLGIFKRLKAEFGLTHKKRPLKTGASAKGTVDGLTTTVKLVHIDNAAFLHVVLEGGRFLPAPLLIVKNGDFMLKAYRPPDETFRLNPDEFPAVNRSIGRPMLEDELGRRLLLLSQLTVSYVFYGSTASLLVSCKATDPAKTAEAVETASTIIARLRQAQGAGDLALHALIGRVRWARKFKERRAALRLLIQRYPREPLARRTLAAVKDDPDFGLSLEAAAALGIDPLTHVRSRFDRLKPEEKLKAVGLLGERGITGGQDFLMDASVRTGDRNLREAIIAALGDSRPNNRTAAFFLAALRDKAENVRAAALEALAVHSGPEALAPLSALSLDRARPAPAARAKAVLDAVYRRLSASPKGRLSLAAAFTRAEDPALREAIIFALGDSHPNKRTAAFFLAALRDKAENVRAAAVEVLAEHGGPEALAPLSALSLNRDRPALAERAKAAAAAIRRRLGPKYKGQLSLSEPEPGAGALSVVKGAPDGKAKSPAPEERKH